MIGTILGNRYKLVSELGSGGMAWVYLADDLLSGGRVAVKILYPQLSREGGFLQRFVQEARLAMSLAAEPEMHVARVLDYGSDRDTHYLVMEYVSGCDLRRVLDAEGPFSWQEAFDVGRQVTLALGHAHRHGIVHRDIKPGNIMLTRDGTVRVLDFGVARALNSPPLTQSGFVGSPYYAAPEQAMGRPVDIRADLYSLGVVLCEMLTGKLPFDADTPWGVITQHIASPPPDLDETYPDIPAPVARLVKQAMAKRPEDRFQSPGEMVAALESVLSGAEPSFDVLPADPGVLDPLLAGLYDQAEESCGAGQWQEAVDAYTQILKLDPRYRDVPDRLAEAGRQVRLAALYSGARRSMKAARWADALAQLDEIGETMPDYRDVRELRLRVRQKQEVERLYQEGIERLQAREWAEAVRCLARVLEREPGYGQAADLLATARAELERPKRPAPPVIQHLSSSSGGSAARRRPRSLLWAAVVVLTLALTLESLLVFRPWQWPVSATNNSPTATSPATPGQREPTAMAVGSVLDPLPDVVPGAAVSPAPPTSARAAPTTAVPARPSPSRTPATLSPSPLPSSTARPAPSPTKSPPPTVASAADLPALTPTAGPPALTPTAEPPLTGQIAFPRFDPVRGTYDVYTCRADGTGCRLIARECSQPDWLPDGSRLAVHSWKAGARGLDVLTSDGRLVWHLTGEIEAARPSVDARGELYVYHSRSEVDRRPRLYRTVNTETRPIWNGSTVVPGQSPSWLPDGRIVYTGCVGDDCGILVVHADGLQPRQVAAGGSETNPEASPDGRQLVFMSRRDGNWEVYRVNVDGTGLQRLTNRDSDDGLPVWSPDGRHIAFVSNAGGRWQVWAMEADGSHQRALFAIGGSPDGLLRDAMSYETYGWVEERISWAPVP